MKRTTVWLTIAGVLSLVPATAHASDPAAAEALFRDGVALAKDHDYPAACAKLEESQKLDAGIGTLYHLADCHEHLDKIATAWGEFRSVAADAKLRNQPERAKLAGDRADALFPRLPHLALDGAPPPGATVRRDRIAIGAGEIGSLIPIDPGTHRISVELPGHVTWTAEIDPAEGQTARVLLPAHLTTSGDPIASNGGGVSGNETGSTGSTTRNVGIGLAGAALVGLGIGTYYGVRSIEKRDDSRDHCTGNVCDADGVRFRSDAISSGNVATVAFVTSAVVGVAGGVMIVLPSFTSDSHPSATAAPPPRATLVGAAPWWSGTSGGFAVNGRFQ